MINLIPYKKAIQKIAKAMSDINNYEDYRKHTSNELEKGIYAEIAFKIFKKLRPTYELFLDKNGDGGTDVLEYDVKYIPFNGKYLILYPDEIFKADKYAAVRVSEDFNNADYLGEISSVEFAKKCFKKDFGYGDRMVMLLTELKS